eukprot:TRINITY_DN15109_c0_g1_i1.p2 TRINITY_DN15109_c0_g1~~TRINITY_DN15109_c0_g1_i1.p2  ORF type:complete len:244 (+),score=40.82 TRINITY_DN15109_c0_g1_i1:1002-1733(+)
MDPSLSREECFHLWVQLLLRRQQIQPQSALQYLTYYTQSLRSAHDAMRRASSGQLQVFERHEHKMERVPALETVLEALSKASGTLRAALALQMATGSRWVDLERLRGAHIQLHRADSPPDFFMVTFVRGKTDSRGSGQSLLLPKEGRLSLIFLEWFESQRLAEQAPVFGNLTYTAYNEFLKENLCVTTQLIRHSSLNAVAESRGEEAAQALARHRSVQVTRGYLRRGLWEPVKDTALSTPLLQ